MMESSTSRRAARPRRRNVAGLVRALGFTQYEPKPAGRGPDARACSGSREGSADRIPQDGGRLTRDPWRPYVSSCFSPAVPSGLMETVIVAAGLLRRRPAIAVSLLLKNDFTREVNDPRVARSSPPFDTGRR